MSNQECMGIETTIVGNPVSAHNFETTAESIPPETPTTRLLILFLCAYETIQY
jgi:hypothetical protein